MTTASLPTWTNESLFQNVGTVIFAFAILHTFLAKKIHLLSHHFVKHSLLENLFHFLGEVEVAGDYITRI